MNGNREGLDAADRPNGNRLVVGWLENGQIKEAAALFGRAFADERFFSYLLRGRDRDHRERALTPMFRAMLRTFLPLGHCYLETFGERTAALYRRRGFVVREEIRPLPEGPDGWTMWREPRT